MSAPIDIVDGGLRQERFPKPLRVLHWSIAALVVVQFSLILILKNLQALNFGAAVLELHQQSGLVVLALILTRFAVGLGVRTPRNEGRCPSGRALPPGWCMARSWLHWRRNPRLVC
jgi:cytochrome b561